MWQPPGPISQCIDTNREDQFGIPLRKYRFRASAGRSIEFGDREDQVPKDMRLSRRTARCGTDLNERYHQDMKQFLKTWPKTKRSSLRVQSAGSLESPALPQLAEARFLHPSCTVFLSRKDQTKLIDGRRLWGFVQQVSSGPDPIGRSCAAAAPLPEAWCLRAEPEGPRAMSTSCRPTFPGTTSIYVS